MLRSIDLLRKTLKPRILRTHDQIRGWGVVQRTEQSSEDVLRMPDRLLPAIGPVLGRTAEAPL
jgi:hypothetical protein